MSGDAFWRRLDTAAGDFVTLRVDGVAVTAFEGETVATLLLRLGRASFGTHPVSGAPLAPLCLMGTCFGCLCTIDDRPGSQACLQPVREGLEVVTGATENAP